MEPPNGLRDAAKESRCACNVASGRVSCVQSARGTCMFTWTSLPTFAAMLLFWLLAAYVLTRSPRSAVSWTAVAAQIATGCYLLGQGMQANAQILEQWLPW